jgi:hypothetical protein
MLINNVDVRKYSRSFDPSIPQSVAQFLEVFGCCKELRDTLRLMIEEWNNQSREIAENLSFGKPDPNTVKESKGKTRAPRPTQAPLKIVVDMCPRCGSKMVGEPLSMCESKESGRVFYKECTACTYYAEIFKKRNKYIKSEGG